MIEKILKLLSVLKPVLGAIFSKERREKRRLKKIEKKYEKRKNKINEAIEGKEDITVVTDDLLGNTGLDVQYKEESNN